MITEGFLLDTAKKIRNHGKQSHKTLLVPYNLRKKIGKSFNIKLRVYGKQIATRIKYSPGLDIILCKEYNGDDKDLLLCNNEHFMIKQEPKTNATLYTYFGVNNCF